MNRSYFFVRTPIQYYNAIEAKESLPKNAQCFLIILSDYPKTLSQFKELVDHEMWVSVLMPWKKYGDLTKSKFLNRLLNITRRLSINAIFKSIEESDTIFWGNYNSIWLRYFISKKNNTVSILDDGFATLSLVSQIQNNRIVFVKNVTTSGFIDRLLVSRSTSIPIKRLKFFTSFRNISPLINERSTFTEYPFLRKQANQNFRIEEKMYFIGQPLIRLSLMTKVNYIKNINRIFDFYKKQGLKCFYIPHRTSKLDYFPKQWNTINFNFPLENLIFEENESLPRVIASFYSSALYFVNKFGQNQEINFEYWKAMDLEGNRNIENCYAYIKKEKSKNTVIHQLDT